MMTFVTAKKNGMIQMSKNDDWLRKIQHSHWLNYHAAIKNDVLKSFVRILYMNGVFSC